jgi:hypothetical protein
VSTLATSTVERIDAFFDQLASRGHVPLLDHVSGTLEFDIEGADRRWMTIDRGDLVVNRNPVPPDCVLICDPDTFIRILPASRTWSRRRCAVRSGWPATSRWACAYNAP